ncbi:MAG: transcription-repair coupling factor [Candidatus Kapaibacteriales bacterium]
MSKVSELRFDLLEHLKNISISLVQKFDQGESFSVRFLYGSSKSALVSALFARSSNRKLIIITPNPDEASKWLLDMTFFFDSNKVFTTGQFRSYRLLEKVRKRSDIQVLGNLIDFAKNPKSILITTADFWKTSIPDLSDLLTHKITLEVGETIAYDEFLHNLLIGGFERVDFIQEQGQIAVRGAIVDVFPYGLENPLRIEFFGDEIESLRLFEIESQRSFDKVKKVEIISKIFPSNANTKQLVDFVSPEDIIIVDSPEEITRQYPDFELETSNQCILINSLKASTYTLSTKPQAKFHSSVSEFVKTLLQQLSAGYKVFISADGELLIERLQEIIENAIELISEKEMFPYVFNNTAEIVSKITFFDETVSEGFEFEDPAIVFYTEHEIFGRERTRKLPLITKGQGINLSELRELNIGDYVVHIDKGIAKFDGIERVKLGGNYQDCVRLVFADSDLLYLNLNYLHKLQKYRAEEGVVPKLSKLGSREWERKKEQTKERLKKIARDLILLYAKRKQTRGFSFPADTIWQREFEASFMYQDTIDQARTTEEVKRDMEAETPMDRLICGDVGFGKTEVAIRSAFKAVQAGKQVAVIVPTTILASQHELTFRDRLQNYPVIIESLSRFKSKKETKDILQRLAEGKIDIIIGTHRLLSNDVKFKDLGLLIVDEEHRFGVASKEKLRQMKVNVDTLMMTATPIPRTLNFSLLGVRDLSIMETPPKNRLPIYTEVIYWDEKVITEALQREFARSGQVFFVVDEISKIEKTMQKLLKIAPNARIGVAHGQMKGNELEKVMQKFIAGAYDILLTTKIIESGLDIPRANSIFISNAQNFGLAELYQLRGRVGRTNIQAYCYLIIPPLEALTPQALRRLQALEEYTDLGSGLKLAMRDLEIRGAGDIFGVEQSGFINEIGFEMYHKILDEAIAELKNDEFQDLFPTTKKDKFPPFLENKEMQIEVDFDAFIPQSYVRGEADRFKIYKDLYRARSADELNQIRNELFDKFGRPPIEVKNLFLVLFLRMHAMGTGIEKITYRKNLLKIEFPPKSNEEFYNNVLPILIEFIHSFPKAKLSERTERLILTITVDSFTNATEFLWKFKKTLQNLLQIATHH